MEQDGRAVPDLPEGGKEQGGEVAGDEGLARRAASSEQEDSSAADIAGGHGAAGSEGNEEEVLEEALTEEPEGVAAVGNAGHGDASRSAENEDHEVPENRATHFEFRGFRPARRAIAQAMPPSSYHRQPLRSRTQPKPSRPIVLGAAASGGANAHDPGTSEAARAPPPSGNLGSASATSRSASLSATANAGQGAKKEALGSTASRSELDAAVGRSSSDDRKSGTEAKDAAAAASSYRLPSRSRKQRRPDHFTPEDEAAARAKAHRSNIVLDRFLTSVLRTSPEQRPEWVRNITADDVRGQGEHGTGGSGTASGGGPEEPDGSATILAVLAVLGASLALSVISCVLFYIVDQRTESGPSDKHQKK